MRRSYFLLVFIMSALGSIAQNNNRPDTTGNISTVIGSASMDSNILIVINGSVVGTIREIKKDIRTIPADIIESMDILKGFKATDKYGEKGKAGVIEFYLKNVKIEELGLGNGKMDANGVYQKVDIEAAFPGSEIGWRRYLERTLNATVPMDKGAPAGTYTVIAQFIVDTEGKISDVKALTKHGYGMEEEVIKVISKGPDWQPAVLNGRTVKAYRKQPVTFQITDDDWFKLSTRSIPAGNPTLIEIKEMDFVKDEDLVVTVSAGTITWVSGKKFIVTVDKPGITYLSVKKKAKKKKDEFDYGRAEIKVE